MKQTRRDSETGEYQKIDVSAWGAARYLVFRNASNEQIGMTLRICWRAIVFYTISVFWGWTVYAGKEPPYLPLSEGKSIAQQVTDLRLQALEDSLMAVKKAHCTVANKDFASKRLRELKRQYQMLTGTRWDEPACDEL